ncbi:hypothetical protein JMUB7531_28830 [Staphylococcus aureus]
MSRGLGDVYKRQVRDQIMYILFFQAEDGIRDLRMSRGLGDVYKRQGFEVFHIPFQNLRLSLIHI